MDIKAADVKTLREKTGAGMMDCKKALQKAEGDFVKAIRLLKELGLAAAGKRSDRETKEGRVFSLIENGKGVLLELSCETDFVSQNSEFVALGQSLTQTVLNKGLTSKTGELETEVNETMSRIKENMVLRRFSVLETAENELLVDYIHGEGRIAVIVKLRLSDGDLKDNDRIKETAFDFALHVAAFAPLSISRGSVDQDYLKEQESLFLKQAEKLDKPEKVKLGIAKGKLNKHLSEICLLEQGFVKDDKTKTSQVLKNLSEEVGGTVEIADFLYYKAGE